MDIRNVLLIKMKTGESIVGNFEYHDEERKLLTVSYPMEVINIGEVTDTSILLRKYMPFCDDQYLTISTDNVVFSKVVDENFGRYYHNTVLYQRTYIEPQTEQNMIDTNEALERVVSLDNQKFLELARKYKVDLTALNSGPIH